MRYKCNYFGKQFYLLLGVILVTGGRIIHPPHHLHVLRLNLKGLAYELVPSYAGAEPVGQSTLAATFDTFAATAVVTKAMLRMRTTSSRRRASAPGPGQGAGRRRCDDRGAVQDPALRLLQQLAGLDVLEALEPHGGEGGVLLQVELQHHR